MVSKQRIEELEEISNIESLINKNVKEDKESKELFSNEFIEGRTDINEEETSIIARLKFLSDELELVNFKKVLIYLMELRLSKNRQSRKEFIEVAKKENILHNSPNGFNNIGGFNNGR